MSALCCLCFPAVRVVHIQLDLQVTEELTDTTTRLENELKNLAVSLQSGACVRRVLMAGICSLRLQRSALQRRWISSVGRLV